MLDTIAKIYNQIDNELYELGKTAEEYQGRIYLPKEDFRTVLKNITGYYNKLNDLSGQLLEMGAIELGSPAYDKIWRTFEDEITVIEELLNEDYIHWFIFENRMGSGLQYNGIRVYNRDDMVNVVYREEKEVIERMDGLELYLDNKTGRIVSTVGFLNKIEWRAFINPLGEVINALHTIYSVPGVAGFRIEGVTDLVRTYPARPEDMDKIEKIEFHKDIIEKYKNMR